MSADRDLELWQKWHQSKSSTDLEALLRELNPLIQAEVNRRSGTLNRGTLQTQAKILTVKALESYDPIRGVKLSTHVTNQLQKLSRMNYANQNAFRVPEQNMLQFQTYQVAKDQLEGTMGRAPTVDELSDELRWSSKRVLQMQRCVDGSELLESGVAPTGVFTASTHDPRLGYAYHSMSPRQQEVFRYTTGFEGAERLTGAQMMKQLDLTQGQLSYEKLKVKKVLQDAYR